MISCIRCACGNRVREEDLIEAGLYLADSGTGSVYVKFICSRCERVAQRTLSIAEWDEGRILFVGSADDEAPDWVDDRRSWTADDTVRLAGVLREHGVSLVDTSTGANVPVPIPVGPGYQVPFAARAKAEAGISTMAVGLILGALQAEAILKEGHADLIAIGRQARRAIGMPLATDLARQFC